MHPHRQFAAETAAPGRQPEFTDADAPEAATHPAPSPRTRLGHLDHDYVEGDARTPRTTAGVVPPSLRSMVEEEVAEAVHRPSANCSRPCTSSPYWPRPPDKRRTTAG